MIKDLVDTEIKYINCFSRRYDNDDFIRFSDRHLEEMYAFNLTKILKKDNVDTIISQEMEFRKSIRKLFLLVDFDFYQETYSLNIKPKKIYRQIYMVKEYNKESCNLNSNEKVEKATSFHDFEDIINLNIEDMGSVWGIEFTNRRSFRKIDIYHKNKNLNPYIFYVDNKPVGFCEIFLNDDIIKIEDFYILEKYRNKGLGRKLLNAALNDYCENKIKLVYIVAEDRKTIKEIYKRLGFEEKYKKTQFLYYIN